MAQQTVLVTDHFFEDLQLERRLLDGVADVVELDDDEERANEQFDTADAILNSLYELDESTIQRLDDCAVISRYGIGLDHINIEMAEREGIHVANTPTYAIEEVAVHTVSLLLNLSRRVKQMDAIIADDGWRESPPTFYDANDTHHLPIQRLSTATVGFVGFGKIGQAVCDRLSGFDSEMNAADPYVSSEDVPDLDVSFDDFNTVVERADYVTIHSPLTEETEGLFDAETFDRMKDTAYLINCSRGPIVEEEALLEALSRGAIEGAALDVFHEEPLPEGHPLRDHNRVITTPHLAYYSEEADEDRRREAVDNVLVALRGERPPNAVTEV